MTRAPARSDVPVAPRLLALEPLWLLLLAPLLLLPGRFVPIEWHWAVVLATMLFWPLRLWLEGRVSLFSPATVAAGLLLLALPAAIWIAVDRPRAWEVAGYLLLGVSGANALLFWPAARRRPAWVAAGLLAFAAALAVAGPLVITEGGWAAPLLIPLQRAAGSAAGLLGESINPNILAHALLVALPLALALALTPGWTGAPPRPWLRAVAALLAAWLLLVLLLTESRGAFLALAVVLPLLLMLRWPRLTWLAPLLLAAGAAVLLWQGTALLDLMTTSSATTGIRERVEIWQRAWWIAQDAPFTGMGLGAFSRVVPLLYPYILIADGAGIPDAHNLPLQVAADLGIPGLLAWLAVQGALLVLLVRLLRDRTSPLRWALAAGALGSLVATWVAGIFGAVNWGVKPAFLPWILAALVVLLHRQAAGEAMHEAA